MKNKISDSLTLDANEMRGIDCGRFLHQKLAVSNDALSVDDDSTAVPEIRQPILEVSLSLTLTSG